MIEDAFYCNVEHAQCIQGSIESADCRAYQIDDPGGLAANIGFLGMPIPKVDYFHKNDDEILLIELSDLNKMLKGIQSELAEITESQISRKEQKAARRKAFSPLVNEFQKKWCGSIAIIERLYRKNGTDRDPNFSLLIVLKNGIKEPVILDNLCQYLEGMIKHTRICCTKEVSACLARFDQE